jgi:uncharacterized protein YecE (DUF72 family)
VPGGSDGALASKIRVGCSSWTSDAWWGRVYPRGLADGDRLKWYAKLWDTVEVDSSYYRDPGPYLVERWARVTPESFRFTMKFPRDLLDPKKPVRAEEVARFLGHARLLGPKLGAVVLQFPPWVKPGRAEPFLKDLLNGLEPDLRYSVELRDPGWFGGATFERLVRSLADRRIALTWSYLTYVDVPAVVTSDFVYLRFIGDHTTVPETTHGEIRVDRSKEIGTWAQHLREHSEEIAGGFAFFNNHFAGFAPTSVNEFRAALGLPPIPFALPQPRTLDG